MRQSENPEPHVRIPSLGFCQQEKETPENLALMYSSDHRNSMGQEERKSALLEQENKTL